MFLTELIIQSQRYESLGAHKYGEREVFSGCDLLPTGLFIVRWNARCTTKDAIPGTNCKSRVSGRYLNLLMSMDFLAIDEICRLCHREQSDFPPASMILPCFWSSKFAFAIVDLAARYMCKFTKPVAIYNAPDSSLFKEHCNCFHDETIFHFLHASHW